MTRLLRSPFLVLSGYYLLLLAVFWFLVSEVDFLRIVYSMESLSELRTDSFLAPGTTSVSQNPVDAALLALFSSLGGLLLLIPVVWVYMVTKQREGYDESVVHTVLILPVAVTGLVIVVSNSVALAFSLAGIVAAVRFRNTLKDTKDAVYIFLAIGTALAAGVQALSVALVTSMVFNYVVLITWRFQIGNIYRDQLGLLPRMRLGDVLAGAGSEGAGTGNLTIGDPELLAALTPRELGELAERKSRLTDKIRSAGKNRKFNGLLIVHAHQDSVDAPTIIEETIARFSEGYELSEITNNPAGGSTLEYLVALEKDIPASRLVSALREHASEQIVAAEFRSISTKKK